MRRANTGTPPGVSSQRERARRPSTRARLGKPRSTSTAGRAAAPGRAGAGLCAPADGSPGCGPPSVKADGTPLGLSLCLGCDRAAGRDKAPSHVRVSRDPTRDAAVGPQTGQAGLWAQKDARKLHVLPAFCWRDRLDHVRGDGAQSSIVDPLRSVRVRETEGPESEGQRTDQRGGSGCARGCLYLLSTKPPGHMARGAKLDRERLPGNWGPRGRSGGHAVLGAALVPTGQALPPPPPRSEAPARSPTSPPRPSLRPSIRRTVRTGRDDNCQAGHSPTVQTQHGRVPNVQAA